MYGIGRRRGHRCGHLGTALAEALAAPHSRRTRNTRTRPIGKPGHLRRRNPERNQRRNPYPIANRRAGRELTSEDESTFPKRKQSSKKQPITAQNSSKNITKHACQAPTSLKPNKSGNLHMSNSPCSSCYPLNRGNTANSLEFPLGRP